MIVIKILLVDDHDLVRLGIKRLLADVVDVRVIGEAATGREAIELVPKINPDIVIMDVKMPDMDGLEATRRLTRMYPEVKILALSAYVDEPYPSRVLQAGAAGYMTKDISTEELVDAIRKISMGKKYLSVEVAQILALKRVSDEGDNIFDSLSEREMQVLLMIANGMRAVDIAKKLFISSKTVNSYRYRLFEKLGVESDVELARLAIKHGLVELD